MSTSKESNLSKKVIYSVTKFTTTDYPDHLSCIVWFASCNMRCLYCYNPDIVLAHEGTQTLGDLYAFLKKRIGLLDSVVLSGGEATSQPLLEICRAIKSMGFKIKLDTNGTHPDLLNALMEAELVDFVALDFKAPKEKFFAVTKTNHYERFLESLKHLIAHDGKYEVRTTLHHDLLTPEDLNAMIGTLLSCGYTKPLYIQNFLPVENLGRLEPSTKSFDTSLLRQDLEILWRN